MEINCYTIKLSSHPPVNWSMTNFFCSLEAQPASLATILGTKLGHPNTLACSLSVPAGKWFIKNKFINCFSNLSYQQYWPNPCPCRISVLWYSCCRPVVEARNSDVSGHSCVRWKWLQHSVDICFLPHIHRLREWPVLQKNVGLLRWLEQDHQLTPLDVEHPADFHQWLFINGGCDEEEWTPILGWYVGPYSGICKWKESTPTILFYNNLILYIND